MKLLKKRAQGISLNVIIVAAIALIVLVVLVAIFTGRMGVFGKGISDCTNQNGECTPDTDMVNGKCPNEGAKLPGSFGENCANCCIATRAP